MPPSMTHGPIDITLHVLGRHGFDYSMIDDGVFIGTNMCCQYGFDKELLSKGVRADISLEEDKVDAPKGVDYFLWLPTVNGRPPFPDKLELGVQAISFFIGRNIPLFIHCKNGHGRAPVLFIAYLIRKGMGVDEAIAHVRKQRPTMHLTDEQLDGLKRFAETRAI